MNLLTIIVLLYLAFVMARSYYFGFIKTLFSTFFVILVVAGAYFMSPTVSTMIQGSDQITAYVNQITENVLNGSMADSGSVSLAIIGSALSVGGLKTIAAGAVNDFVMRIMGFVFALLFSWFFWLIIEIILLRISRTRYIGPVNRIAGLVLGSFKGLMVVWMILGFIQNIQFMPLGYTLAGQIEESEILTFINSFNFLVDDIPNILLSFL